jgi:hypothetical protein
MYRSAYWEDPENIEKDKRWLVSMIRQGGPFSSWQAGRALRLLDHLEPEPTINP